MGQEFRPLVLEKVVHLLPEPAARPAVPHLEGDVRGVDGDAIVYQFSRSKVERGDFSHFLALYAPDRLPTGRRLRAMMDSMVFCIQGYDDDPREIHSIPEVRRFYADFHQAWPYWLFFCNLDTDVLGTMVLCCLDSLTEIKVDGRPKVAVKRDPMELLRFLSRDFPPMNLMCERAQIFEDRIYGRTKAVFDYFRLPFDAAFSPKTSI
jgi:hypothetical protein